MHFDKNLFDIDYLVFSSHKTATQTTVDTLRKNGYRATHCHTVRNETVNITPGTFGRFVERYSLQNATKLNIITVFRQPIERHISSFFQRHGSDVLRLGILPDIEHTLIANSSTKKLQQCFRKELARGTLTGEPESIDELLLELDIGISDLSYDTSQQYGKFETAHCILHLFRFDVVIGEKRLESLLSRVTGKSIVQHDENMSAAKWYYERQNDFTHSLKLPRHQVIACYEKRAHLFDLFYPGDYDMLLSRAIARYAESDHAVSRFAHACRRWVRSAVQRWRP